jgi:hypothetical protein
MVHGSDNKKEFDFHRYATTNGDVDLLLNTAISLEHQKRFDEATKFTDTARKAVPLSRSAAFLNARIRSKKLAASGKKSEAKKIVDAILNDPFLSAPTESKKASQQIKWDLSDMYAQPPAPFDSMFKAFLKLHPRDLSDSTSTILWQTAGAPASFYCDESQFYELTAKPPRLGTAFVLGKEAYLLGAKKSTAVRTIFGRITLNYVKELKQQGKAKEASAAAREFLATGCGYNRADIKSFAD